MSSSSSEKKKRQKKDEDIEVSDYVEIEAGEKRAAFASALPVGYLPKEANQKEAAKKYTFELDPFQKLAIEYIEKDESVLVAAHTSAGKTVVAEYAIAACFRDKQRVVYTSPIKALSNQKFRDLQEEFTDVGLMTGDITINPNAKCLVMTTEILRSMLYRGSEFMREVRWVIYDEIHYMRDAERGVVWEESIILLPHNVRYVFLSATIPNALQFAQWICKIHRQPCHIVSTDFRPTPLVHYIFAPAGAGLHLVVDEKGQFRELGFSKAMNALATIDARKDGEDDDPGLTSQKQKKKSSSFLQQAKQQEEDMRLILQHVHKNDLQPCIVFAFSKSRCEKNAASLKSVDYNPDPAEKRLVRDIYEAALRALSTEDRDLPQIKSLIFMLERGVGIHHGGLLPIVKEVVEILFQEGLIKVLFATETFAIGINMPAKTVIFTESQKFDGQNFRDLTSSEYIQMSGRAGRRGKDDKGTVILMLDKQADTTETMLRGDLDGLNSSFHVTYNMLLNLLRVEGADPEFLIGSSFRQFQQEAKLPVLLEEVAVLETGLEVYNDPLEIQRVCALGHTLEKHSSSLRTSSIQNWTKVMPWLQPGRLVLIADKGWGVLLANNVTKRTLSVYTDQTEEIQITDVYGLSAVRVFLSHSPESFAKKSLAEIRQRFDLTKLSSELFWSWDDFFDTGTTKKDKLPLLDAVEDLKLSGDEKYFTQLEQRKACLSELQTALSTLTTEVSSLKDAYRRYAQRESMQAKIKAKQTEIAQARALTASDDLRKMRRVLRDLGHIAPHGVITLKGRAACEVNTADELLASELLLSGTLSSMAVPELVALLSCLVFTEQRKSEPQLRPQLAAAYKLLIDAATTVVKAFQTPQDEYLQTLNPELMELMFQWSQGASFASVLKLTDAYEGTIVRVIRRLEELIRQLASASLAIGNHELKSSLDEAAASIKRNIVFAASLYV